MRLFLLYSLSAVLAAMAGYLTIRLTMGGVPSLFPARENHANEVGAPAPSAGGLHKLIRHGQPKAVPELSFMDADGKERKLAEWRGQAVLLNFWATWCAPCKLEMPALSRLQAQLGSNSFTVLTLSMDRSGPKLPRAFLQQAGITNLPLYNDDTGEAVLKIEAGGLPATLLINAQGQEIARLLGPAEWDSPEAIDVLKALLR